MDWFLWGRKGQLSIISGRTIGRAEMGGIAVEIDDNVGIGIVGENLECDGVDHVSGVFQSEVVLLSEFIFMFVVEM